MARVTAAEVKVIFPTTDGQDMASFIASATLLVDEELVGAGLSEARLKQIELYLSAHFASITLERGGLTKQKIDDAEEDYKNIAATSTGLLATRYGQQAVALDTSGALGGMTKSPVKAQFRVVNAKQCV